MVRCPCAEAMLYQIVRHGLGVLNINHNSDKLTYCASLWLQISTLLIIYFRRSKNILFVIVLVLFYLPLSFYSFPCSRHKGVKWYLLRQPFFQRFCPPFFTFVCRFITFWKSFACSAMILYESDDIFRDRMIIIYARKFNRKRWSKTMKIAFSKKNSQSLKTLEKGANLQKVSRLLYALDILKQNFPYSSKKFMVLKSLQAKCPTTGNTLA